MSILSPLGLTPQHYQNVEAMKKDPSVFGIEKAINLVMQKNLVQI